MATALKPVARDIVADGVHLTASDFDALMSEVESLRRMRERAMLIGASITIAEAPAGGTQVELTIPIAHERAV